MANVKSAYLAGEDTDIHIIRGHAYDLGQRLLVSMDNGDIWWPSEFPVGVTARYSSNLKGTTVANVFTGNGVSINTLTGKVTALSTVPANPRRNFILTIAVSGASVPDGPKLIHIRIHIHKSVVHKWVTPQTLTVRRGMVDSDPARTGMRFSVFAQFDDGIVGDVSNYSHFQNASSANCIRWTPDSNFVNRPREVHDGEILALTTNAAGSTLLITATLPPLLGGGTATATLKFDHEWIPAHPNLVNCVNVPMALGYARRNNVPNVLFLCDGFASASGNNKEKLDSIVAHLVQNIRTEHLFKPLDILIDSMNLWTCYRDSEEDGISIRNELVVRTSDPGGTEELLLQTDATVFDTAALVLADVAGWDLSELGKLIFLVGLPTPVHGKSGDLDAVTPVILTPAQIRDEWKATVRIRDGISEADNTAILDSISDNLIKIWMRRAYRRLPNLKDTAWGCTVGDLRGIPDASDGKNNLFRFDPTRIDRDKLNKFLSTLEAGAGNSMDGIWNVGADGTRGKDFDLIMVLLNSNPVGRENNSDGYFFLQVADPTSDRITLKPDSTNPAASKARTIVSGTVPTQLDKPGATGDTKTSVLIHELAHSFGLDDEYGEGAVSVMSDFYFNYPKPDDGYVVEDLANCGNVQAHVQVTNPGTDDVNGNLIKWRWNRVANAGIVQGMITENGGSKFGIPLQVGNGSKFKNNDIVFLRYRSPNIVVSAQFKVVSLAIDTITIRPAVAVSEESMKVFVYNSELFDLNDTTRVSTIRGPVVKLGNGDYKIVLTKFREDHKANETVKLRTVQPSVIGEHTLHSPSLKVVGTPVGDVVIVSKEKATDVLTLELLLNFTQGSVLYKPVPAFESQRSDTYRFSELVGKNVLDAINRDKIPLTGAVCKIDDSDVQTLTSDIGPIAFPKSTCSCASLNRNEIIGLYSGGSRFHCGIYHPSGHCMMRRHSQTAEFCVVCKYVLTEIIDPTKHAEVDRQISAIYPLIK